MKLLLTKPHTIGDFPSWGMGAAFKGYLQYRNIFIGDELKDFTVAWNDVYSFYDISMYAIAENRGNPTKHIDEAIAVLRGDGAKVEVSHTFRWEGKTQIEGKRLWIAALDA